MTPAEKTLWQFLRKKQLGVKFRRQHPIGPYVADFYCPEKRLVIEIDGDSHAEREQRNHDINRTLYFEAHSLRVKRYTNLQVLGAADLVIQDIFKFVGCSPEGSPLLVPPQAGGILIDNP
jgi:very-short-patch-repair endonuclease